MTEQLFYIDIEDSSGNRLGSGPVLDATGWEYTGRQDRAGAFRFAVPATTAQASVIAKKRVARAWAWLDGTWTEVGAGIIDSIVRRPQADGTILLDVSGDDLLRELTYRSVRDLKLYTGGNPVTHSAAVAAVAAYAPAGWTLTPDASPPNDSVYGRFNGETVLAAAIKIADKSQNHFYRGTGRTLVFGSTFTDSGLRAIQAGPGDLAAETCAITRLSKTTESYDLITRIYPRGSGNGDVQLTLKATTRTAPTGYTLNASGNTIDNDTAQASYGVIEQYVEWRDIGPIANTAADIQAAADMLFDAALAELARRSAEAEADYYDLDVAGCRALLRPMQTIRLVWRDPDADIDVDAVLNILEATWRIDTSGAWTTALKVTTADRWPTDDTGAVVDSITQGQVYQALPQLNANSYVTAYRGNVDGDESAAFRFRFGAEVAQLQQVLLEFQLLAFESTVRTVGGATGGSGTISTTVPSTNISGNPSNNTSGMPSTNTSGVPSTNVSSAPSNNTSGAASGNTGAPSATNSGTPSNNNSGTPSVANSGTPSNNNSGTPSVANSGTPSTNTSGNPSNNSTGNPTGGDVIASGRHQHTVGVTLGATVTYPIGYSAAGTSGGLVSSLPGSTDSIPTNQQGNHTHDLSNHTHTLNNHTHDLGGHTHSLNNHTHDLSNHTHSLNGHTHSLNSHTHDLASHTHTLNNHTHSLGNHTHDLANHIHDLSDSLSAIYGIFREISANTLGIDELQYRVNGGSWLDADTAADAGDGWYQLDITDDVMDANTFRPTQANNLVEFRAVDLESTITLIAGYTSPANLVGAIIAAGSFPPAVGGTIVVAGTTYYDGRWTVTEVNNFGVGGYEVLFNIPGNTEISNVYTGTLTADKTVTIDAQLSVRNVIQAIAYVS